MKFIMLSNNYIQNYYCASEICADIELRNQMYNIIILIRTH